jgi:hypothetical protein
MQHLCRNFTTLTTRLLHIVPLAQRLPRSIPELIFGSKSVNVVTL